MRGIVTLHAVGLICMTFTNCGCSSTGEKNAKHWQVKWYEVHDTDWVRGWGGKHRRPQLTLGGVQFVSVCYTTHHLLGLQLFCNQWTLERMEGGRGGDFCR